MWSREASNNAQAGAQGMPRDCPAFPRHSPNLGWILDGDPESGGGELSPPPLPFFLPFCPVYPVCSAVIVRCHNCRGGLPPHSCPRHCSDRTWEPEFFRGYYNSTLFMQLPPVPIAPQKFPLTQVFKPLTLNTPKTLNICFT